MAQGSLNKILEGFIESFTDSLKLGNRSIFGIEVASSSVKIAELTKGKTGYFLKNFAIQPLPEGAILDDEIHNRDAVVNAIQVAIKGAKVSSSFACLGLSGPLTVVRKIQLAGGNKDEIAEQVEWEADQYIPFDSSESRISHYVIGENEGGGVDVVVAAAKNEFIEDYKDIIGSSGKKLKIVDLSQIALLNIINMTAGDEISSDGKSWILMDIGSQKTHFMILKNGGLVFSKEMAIGGLMITEEIQRQMGVNFREAEDLKISGDGSGNLPEEILEIVDQVMESFFEEIKNTLDFYITSTSDESFVGCFITGGGSLIPSLEEGLETLLGIEVIRLTTQNVISMDGTKLSNATKEDVLYRGAVVLGLAMRELK